MERAWFQSKQRLLISWVLHGSFFLLGESLTVGIGKVIEERLRDGTEIVLLRVKGTLTKR